MEIEKTGEQDTSSKEEARTRCFTMDKSFMWKGDQQWRTSF